MILSFLIQQQVHTFPIQYLYVQNANAWYDIIDYKWKEITGEKCITESKDVREKSSDLYFITGRK